MCPDMEELMMTTKTAEHMTQDIDHNQGIHPDRYLKQQYGNWFKEEFRWSLFATLTFSRDLTSNCAKEVLDKYLRRIEEEARAPLGCLIAEERKHSGLGGAPGRIHFHLLIHCAKPLDPAHLESVWKENRFGGNRIAGKPADVRIYDTAKYAAFYVMKGISDPDRWRERGLEIASRRKPKSFGTSTKSRRRWRREQQRQQANTAQATQAA